jgi:hypothetical protein
MPGEPETGVGDDISGHRQDRHADDDGGRGQRHVQPDGVAAQVPQDPLDRTEVGRVEPRLAQQPEPEADQHRAGDHAGQRRRSQGDPATVQAGEFDLGVAGGAVGCRGRRDGVCCPRRRPVQQFGSQGRHGDRRQPVQPHRSRVGVRAAGPDVHPDQAQQALQRMGADVQRADAVPRHGQVHALQDAATHFDHGRGDPVSGRQVPGNAKGDDHGGADQPPRWSVVVAGARDQQDQQHRDEPDDLADRLDQQHAEGQAPPALHRAPPTRRRIDLPGVVELSRSPPGTDEKSGKVRRRAARLRGAV